jgi:hypothetical protein
VARNEGRWWVRVTRWRRWQTLVAVTKAGGGGEEKKSAKQTIVCLAMIACLAMGMCQTNNRIPVSFRFANPGTIPVSIPD